MYLVHIFFSLSNHRGDRHVNLCEPWLSSALAIWLQCSIPREIRDGSWSCCLCCRHLCHIGYFIRSLSVPLTWAPAEIVPSTILLSLLGQGVFALSSPSAFFLTHFPWDRKKWCLSCCVVTFEELVQLLAIQVCGT